MTMKIVNEIAPLEAESGSKNQRADENPTQTAGGMTLESARGKLAGKTGKKYWRSLEELSNAPGFGEMLEREFPRQASEWVDAVSRRGFLKLAGASMAMAGLAGCTKQPDEPIYPYIRQPEDLVLGKPMYFATAHPFPTGAIPLLVKADAFRPIKVDGNPDHPLYKDSPNRWGPSDAITQGTLMDLYDPDRSQHVTYRGETQQYSMFERSLRDALAARKGRGGAGMYILSATVTSPTLAGQLKGVQQLYPQLKIIQWEPINRDSSRAASKAAFGDYYDAQYRLDQADVILSLDADFLSGIQYPGFLKLSGDYAKRRKLADGDTNMNRLYVVESATSTTGMKAEHRLALKPSEIEAFALALAGGGAAQFSNPDAQKFLTAVQADLKAHNGRCVVILGEQASPAVHQAAYVLNQQLGAVGNTVVYTQTVEPMPTEQNQAMGALAADMAAGKVEWLIVLGVNPVYSAPADLQFAENLKKVPTIAQLSTHVDETSQVSHWNLNQAHYLESWSDARAYDGTYSIVQPLIDPLYQGVTAHRVVQSMLDNPGVSDYEAVRLTSQAFITGDFESGWRKALHGGFLENSAFQPKTLTPRGGLPAAGPAASGQLEVLFRPDANVYDGRYANVGWLQELPRQVTNLSWDNAALISYATAKKLRLDEHDVVEVSANGRKAEIALLKVPGQADDTIILPLGYGRTSAGRVGNGSGFDVYPLRTTAGMLTLTGASIKKTGAPAYDFAVTKSHYTDGRGNWAFNYGDPEDEKRHNPGNTSIEAKEAEDRGIIRSTTLEEFKKAPNFAHEGEGPAKDEREETPVNLTLMNNYAYPKNKWGMAIDMNSCVGCNACVVACYAENNIAVVGKHQVKVGRIMQWLRIDTYYEGDLDAPKAHFQPMLCQHCEQAPCELVCPVGATVHTPEGLNAMVYNRCVGTRYCSNNCPYKVRRFNFLLFSDYDTESLKLMRNPDVTVRSRGVMEKCTYCVQRINYAKIEADKENREVRDGEVVTACQQACPTGAIVFGNVNDRGSRVAKLQAEERSYSVLASVNTRPRTKYIAGVENPNPELQEA